MKPKMLPSQELLLRLLRYEPETGKLFWRRRELSDFQDRACHPARVTHAKWNRRHANKEAFTAEEGIKGGTKRYRVGICLSVRYKAHRIIWRMVTGENPDMIDHIDGNSLNNRIENLRSVSHEINTRNQKLRSTNTTGVNGVIKHRTSWHARVRVADRTLHLGAFATLEEAAECRLAYDRANGFHENHGRVAS